MERGTNAPQHAHHSPGKYIFGYVASLVLTAIAFALALTHAMAVGPLMWILMILAGLQIIVQLYFFMHVTEGDGPPYHAVTLVIGLIFTFGIALMSIWIMSFNSMAY
jgi:cytochrome o ubiquinol oxidase operon protein cyoD